MLDGERADERDGVAKRQHIDRALIFGRVERACLRHERREDFRISPIKEKHARKKLHKRPGKTAAIIGKCPIGAHHKDPKEMGDQCPLPLWVPQPV
jgi:hypothetical protein